QQYLKPDRLSIVLVGNAAAFAPQLQGIGLPQFETIDLDNLDLTAVNFQRAKSAVSGGAAAAVAAVAGRDAAGVGPDIALAGDLVGQNLTVVGQGFSPAIRAAD